MYVVFLVYARLLNAIVIRFFFILSQELRRCSVVNQLCPGVMSHSLISLVFLSLFTINRSWANKCFANRTVLKHDRDE